jgi:2-hydroxymuconate-semialdehyde hydrolase
VLAGLPVVERRLKVGGVATTVLEAGQGPALVLLHGGIESGGAVWAPVIARLAVNHHVVVPDAPGLGESEPVAKLDIYIFADWIAELLRTTHAEQPTLVAHSLLGSLTVRFAARHGELLGQLVLYAVPAIGPYRMPLGLRVVAIRFGIRPTARNAERFDRFALRDLDATRARDPEWYEAFETYTRERATVPHVKRTMRRLVGAQTKQIPDVELAPIAVPTALVWGRHDRMAPLGIAEGASTRFGWPLHVIDDTGHVPHIEQPGAFVDTLSAIESARRPWGTKP